MGTQLPMQVQEYHLVNPLETTLSQFGISDKHRHRNSSIPAISVAFATPLKQRPPISVVAEEK